MATLLVTYDLNKAGQNYSGLYKVLNQYGGVKLSESSYAIQTQESPLTVYNKIRPLMDGNDHVYIVTLSQPYYGYGHQTVNNWLSQHL